MSDVPEREYRAHYQAFAFLDDLLERSAKEGFELKVELVVSSECCWSCDLTYWPTSRTFSLNKAEPSYCFSVGSGTTPGECLSRCLKLFSKSRLLVERLEVKDEKKTLDIPIH